MASDSQSTDARKSTPAAERKIIIRPWPKILFLYPTFIAALVAGVWQGIHGTEEDAINALKESVVTASAQQPNQTALEGLKESVAELDERQGSVRDMRETIGMLFFVVFALNLLVISFEFSRIKTVAIFFLVIAVVCFVLYMATKYPVMKFLGDLFWGLELRMSSSYYFAMAGYFVFVYIAVFINTRWNYWVIRHNEIIHYTGFLGDIKRFPSPNLRMTKTIDDVFEFILLGSGRIALYPASEREPIVLNNVLGVNRAEKAIKRLLSALAVQISPSDEISS